MVSYSIELAVLVHDVVQRGSYLPGLLDGMVGFNAMVAVGTRMGADLPRVYHKVKTPRITRRIIVTTMELLAPRREGDGIFSLPSMMLH